MVHVQHYENMDTRTPINNLRKYSRAVRSQPRLVTHAGVVCLDFVVCVWVHAELFCLLPS